MKYSEVRSMMKTGDLLEWRSPSFLGKVIRLFTKKNVNHTGMIFALNDYPYYEGYHIFTLEAEPKGIVPNLLSAQLKGYKGKVYWKPLKPEFDHLRNKGIGWALSKVGTKYDYGSLFKNALSKVSADAKQLFCSEFTFICTVISGILPQFIFDKGKEVVIDIKTGDEVKAPRPGEFDEFNIYLPDIEIEY